MNEMKELIENDKVFFGVRETIRNAKNVERVIVPSDCRQKSKEMLEKSNLEIEFVEFSKQELVEKLGIEFQCEVFGVKK